MEKNNHNCSPADTLFFRATRGDFDIITAMYHDQDHGPI
jgi:4-hydroxy-L-threonine phosphate dehydrogenase PdxA